MPRYPSANLSPGELSDLLNYLLGLPEILGRGYVVRPRMEAAVIGSWIGRSRGQVELWCDYQLRAAGVIPGRPTGRHGGRRPCFPFEAQRLVRIRFPRWNP